MAVHIDENSCFYLGFQVTSLNYFPCCRGEMKLKAPPPMREGGRWIHFASTPCEYLLKPKKRSLSPPTKANARIFLPWVKCRQTSRDKNLAVSSNKSSNLGFTTGCLLWLRTGWVELDLGCFLQLRPNSWACPII